MASFLLSYSGTERAPKEIRYSERVSSNDVSKSISDQTAGYC